MHPANVPAQNWILLSPTCRFSLWCVFGNLLRYFQVAPFWSAAPVRFQNVSLTCSCLMLMNNLNSTFVSNPCLKFRSASDAFSWVHNARTETTFSSLILIPIRLVGVLLFLLLKYKPHRSYLFFFTSYVGIHVFRTW